MGWLFSLLAKVFADSFDAFVKDYMAQKEAEKAGAAAQALKTEQDADAVEHKAEDARDAATKAVASDGGLAAVELRDPNNRDNAPA